MSDTDIAYVAGLFDGEGCVAIRRYFVKKRPVYTLWVQITGVDPRPLLPLKERYGGSIHITKHKSPNQRDTFVWIVTSRNAGEFLKQIRPHLVVKAEQADIAIAFQDAKVHHGGSGKTRVPTGYNERQHRQYLEITELKFRIFNPTDFGMVANSGDTQNGQSRAKQEPKAPGVCND